MYYLYQRAPAQDQQRYILLLGPWICHHIREPTVLPRVTMASHQLTFDRFHQPCLLPPDRHAEGLVETVISVPHGGHHSDAWNEQPDLHL